ncbi:hypothetical protein N7U66_19555 [Lacinutrix neustonica]|uniref:Uncharacterized protein n=1 Tax=Lacinutrix neustonica TaxID=2980107 RepID=A0A9E8SDQ1_9FLAO|nr:hypothetical protein [Lacinutrix neustonica]WAC01997.1 hypothetical protein N7U66_19555 [Lacinutrix neustonica]
MNNFITLPLAVLYSLSISFQAESNIRLENSSSFDDISINTTIDIPVCVESFTDPVIIHNADIGIFPGESNSGKTFIPRTRISPIAIQENMVVTGIKAADDGKQILIYANQGNIILLPNNLNSSFGNRIEQHSNMIIQRGQVFELTYRASMNKWVITNDNF